MEASLGLNGDDGAPSVAVPSLVAILNKSTRMSYDVGSGDTGAWFERRLREPSFVIPEIADFRRQRADASTAGGRAQRGAAREREGAFEHVLVTAEIH